MRSLTDAPVTVTGVEVNREGDGVSYVSLGFPGATVQLLQKLAEDNLADDLKRIAPDVIVLAFGTNEGFNDALDVPAYAAQYEQIVKRLKALRPQARIVIDRPARRRARIRRLRSGGAGCATAAADNGACQLADAAQARPGARSAAPAGDAARSRFLGLVVGDAEPVRRAGMGRRRSAADGSRLRAYDDGRL